MASRKFLPSLEIENAIQKLETEQSHEASSVIFTELVKCLRSGEPLPSNLADFIADGFEVALAKGDRENRAKALTRELGLTTQNRRRKVTASDAGEYLEKLIEPAAGYDSEDNYIAATEPMKSGEAYQLAAEHFKCTERTIEKNWQAFKSEREREYKKGASEALQDALNDLMNKAP